MKTIIICSIGLLIVLFTSCKKDEFIDNTDEVVDTVAISALQQYTYQNYYFLLDQVHLWVDATTPGAISYQWLPSNETTSVIECLPNKYIPSGPGYSTSDDYFGGYEVIITLPDTTLRYGFVIYADEAVIYCANSFAPDGDGTNDLWQVYYDYRKITLNSLTIYNSRDKKVFHSVAPEYPSWDGKYNGDVCESGMYYYTVHYTSVNGKKKSREGMLQLIR
jgi:gliding motility-associated-like protein